MAPDATEYSQGTIGMNFPSWKFVTASQPRADHTIASYYELIEEVDSPYSGYRRFKAKYFTGMEVLTPSQGEIYQGLMYGTDINDYPSNGEKDSIWYVYKGIT